MVAHKPISSRNTVPGASPCVLTLRQELAEKSMRSLLRTDHAGRTVELALGRDSLWMLVRRDAARLAVRTAYSPSGLRARVLRPRKGEAARITLTSAVGRHTVMLRVSLDPLPLLRVVTTLVPAEDLLIPHLPRDLYPLDGHDDPLGAAGSVEAAQRGLNAGLLYWRIDEPTPGSLLYLQNLTALNPYFQATRTRPDGAVGGEWPELGYLPPTPPQSGTPPVHPLPKDKEVTLSDATIVFHHEAPCDEAHSARLFLQMLGTAYRQLDTPPVTFHDWPTLAERTVDDLATAPTATVRRHGATYVFGPGDWWCGFDVKRAGSFCHALQMAS